MFVGEEEIGSCCSGRLEDKMNARNDLRTIMGVPG